MAKEFVYKARAEGDFSSLTKEVAELNAQLAAARGSVSAFKEELERNTKGQTEYKIVIRSDFDASGTRVAKAELVQVNDQYDGLLRTLKQIEKEPQRKSLTSLRQQRNEAKQARDALSQYASGFDGIGNQIRVINPLWNEQNEKVRRLSKELSVAEASGFWGKLAAQYDLGGLSRAGRQITDFVNVFQSLAIIVGQVQASINGLVNAVAGLQSFSLAFRAIDAGAAGGAQALSESSRIALNLGSDLTAVRQGFQQLSPVILNTGGTISDVSNVVETLSSRFAAFGISGDKARRVTNGVIQAFAKGKLMAEELTQQISEADPAFKTDLAKALGFTTAQLEENVKAGKVTGKVLLENLPKLSKSALLYGKLGISALDAARSLRTNNATIDQVRNKITTLNQLSLERLANSIKPVLFAFLEVGASITDFVDRISKLGIIKSISAVLSALAGTASTLVQTFLNAAEGLIVFTDAANALVGPFLKIPGVAQLIGIALAAKLIKPLQGLKDQFLKNSAAATGFVGSIRALSTFSGLEAAFKNNIIAPFQKFTENIKKAKNSSDINIFRDIITGSLGAKLALKEIDPALEKFASKSETVARRIDKFNNVLDAYRARLSTAQKAAASGILGGDADNGIDRLSKKIGRLRGIIERLENQQASIGVETERLGNRKKRLTGNLTFLDRGLNAAKGSFVSLKGAVRGLYSLVGPLGLALLALGVATNAYQSATSESNAILQESSDRVETLKKAIEDLGGSTSATEKPVEGLALAWLTFGNIVADVVDGISGLLDGLSRELQKAVAGVNGLTSRVGAVALGAGIGALAGSFAGPFGAAIGAVVGGLITFAATGNAVDQQIKQIKRSGDALKESLEAIVPQVKILSEELNKLSKNEKVQELGSPERKKFIQGLEQEKNAIQELQNIYKKQKINEEILSAGKNKASKEANRYGKEVARLTAELKKQIALRDKLANWKRPLGNRYVDSPALINAQNAVKQVGKQLVETKEKLRRAEAGVKSFHDQLSEAQRRGELTKKELDKLIANRKQNRLNLGWADETNKVIDSISELSDEIKVLETEIQNIDFFAPNAVDRIDEALTKIEQFKFITEKLQRTKIQAEFDIRNLQQSIAESQLKIDLDPGPLREAGLLVSKITNDYKDAQVVFTKEVQAINKAFEGGVAAAKKQLADAKASKGTEEEKAKLIKEANQAMKDAEKRTKDTAQQKADLIKEAALKLVGASKESQAALVDAVREYRKQLDAAKSSYQSLVLGNKGFFTDAEIRKNAEQIEKDFQAAVEKVRKDTGEGGFFPKLEGETADELLASKKAFTDTRSEADDLKTTIKTLNVTLEVLGRVLAKILNLNYEDLKKFKLDPKQLTGQAVDAQKKITGMGQAAKKAASSYGKIVGTSVLGGIKMISVINETTGEVETLTEKEYKAAKAAEAAGTASKAAFEKIRRAGKDAANAFGGVGDASKKVIGEYVSNGKKLFLVEDQFTGKTEELTQAQLDQAGIVNDLAGSYEALGISISKAGKLTGEYLKRRQEEGASLAPGTAKIAENLGIDATTTQNVINAARAAGGDYLKTLGTTISEGQLLAPRVLNNLANVTQDYRLGLEMVEMTQNAAKTAQENYNAALKVGGSDLLMAAAGLDNANAALDAARYNAEQAATAYREGSEAARQLGIDMNTVVEPGTVLQTSGPENLTDAYFKATNAVLGFKAAEASGGPSSLEDFEGASVKAQSSLDSASGSLRDGSVAAVSMAGSLDTGATAAAGIASSLNSLDGKTINVNVNYVGTPGLWTGGPTVGGQTYRINELGKEGFLSSTGDLSPINKPRNALWKAPGKGMVIPAHIMSTLDVPTGRVSTGVRPAAIGSGGNGMSRIVRAIQNALIRTSTPDPGIHEMASVQAHQAQQIGKLSRAVTKLADKDWNVNVGVRNTGSTAYLDALNRRM